MLSLSNVNMAWVPILYAIKQRVNKRGKQRKKKTVRRLSTTARSNGDEDKTQEEHVYNFSVIIIKKDSTTRTRKHHPQATAANFLFRPWGSECFHFDRLYKCFSIYTLPVRIPSIWLPIVWINYQDTLASIKQYLRRMLAYRSLTNLELKYVNIMKCTY